MITHRPVCKYAMFFNDAINEKSLVKAHMLEMTLPKRPHVLVFGNLKGGSGKSTLSMHVALGLMGTSNNQGAIMRTRVGELFTDDL